MDNRRTIPAVESVLKAMGPLGLPRAVVVDIVRREMAALRRNGTKSDLNDVLARIRPIVTALKRSGLQSVINGTGVVLHTNLGRAPLGPAALAPLADIAGNYTNLELDLVRGERGGRASYLEHNLALLCGAPAATVVNNCAAALVLAVRHLTRKKPEVVISRGELVQIGGGFRVPEILESTGARLREVGTTNRTSLGDYAAAIGPATGLLLKVHRSNFVMEGFVGSPAREPLAALARQHHLPFVEDLGSGAIVPMDKFPGLEHEPTPAEVLKSGLDLVTFSGDKLLGGPQAGIIAGKAPRIARLKREPLFRALRCDKLRLSVLQTTVDLYLDRKADDEIPLLLMLQMSIEELKGRGDRILAALEHLPLNAELREAKARLGGGSLPRSTIASITIDLLPAQISLTELANRLRTGTPPVVGYIADKRLKLDLRTVFPRQDEQLVQAIRAALVRAESSAQSNNTASGDPARAVLEELVCAGVGKPNQ